MIKKLLTKKKKDSAQKIFLCSEKNWFKFLKAQLKVSLVLEFVVFKISKLIEKDIIVHRNMPSLAIFSILNMIRAAK
jgi:hypothetical protein